MLANISSELSTIQNGRYGEDIRTAIKEAIRKVNDAGYMPVVENLNVNANGTYTPSAGVNGFSKVVVNVPSGSPVVEPLTANSNGVYTPSSGVDGYSQVTVAVPGKTLIEKLISTNGTYSPSSDNADGYNSVIVDVPSLSPTLQPLSISSNGVYTPSSGVDGYSQVTVAVYPGLLPTHYFDLDKGYVSNGKWTIGGDTVSYSDVYQVIAGYSYFIVLGDTVGTRFRVMFSEADTSISTGNIMGTSVYNVNNPEAYSCTLFLTAPNDGFLTITKDNAGVSGLKTYVFRVDELAEGTSSGSGDTVVLVAKNINANGTYNPSDDNADGYSNVTVNVPGGGGYPEPTGTISITENGTVNVKDYASANVNVQPNLQSKTATQNGTVTADTGYDGLSSVIVDVTPNLQNKTATQNGTVTADTGYNGLGSVVVDVPTESSVLQSLSVSANGTYTPPSGVDGYSEVMVNVPVAGISMDDIAMRSISGSIYGSASYIGSWAFATCSSLTEASFPACTSIGSGAFQYCFSLTSASFPACTSIGFSAFQYCSSITKASFPACTNIGSYAFIGCKKLTSVNFPACTSIGTQAFGYCSSLTSVSFPACTSIGGNAFYNCYNLLSLYLTGSSLCKLPYSNVFTSTPIAGYTTSTGGVYGSIYVPTSLLTSYKSDSNWSYYSERFVGI